MRHLLYIALFLLYCTCGCFAAVVQQLPQKGKSALQTYTVSTDIKTDEADGKSGNDWRPISIGVYTKIVDYVVKECERINGDDDFQNFKEELEGFGTYYSHVDEFLYVELEVLKRLCIDGDNKMTEEKKNILFQNVLPKAIKLHTDRLKVNTVKESATISSDDENFIINYRCGAFGVHWKHKFKDSDDVDFMIFASLSDEHQKVKICTQKKNKRPMSALIKFIPKEIKATRQYIRLTAHEIAHALGFQHDLLNTMKMIETRHFYLRPKGGSISPRNPYMVKFPQKILKILEEHFDCTPSTLKGLYLENEGEDRWSPSHWERLIAKDELMSTYIGEPTGMYYSVLTLAVFHSLPFYSADFSMAEPMSWGNKSGCDFFEGKITKCADTKYPNMFCKEDKKILQCTSDRFALGMCLTKKKRKDLPQEYQYFKDEDGELENDLMDGYPIIRPLMGTACDGGNKKLLPGSLLGSDSRCLKGEGLQLQQKRDDVTFYGICAKVKCDKDKVYVQYKGDPEGPNKWHNCENDGTKIKLEGSEFQSGTIVCPKYEEVCTVLPKNETPTIKFYYGKDVHGTYKDGYGGKKEEENEERNQNRAQLPYPELEGSTDTQSLQDKDGVNKPKEKGQNNGHSSSSSVSSESVSRVTSTVNNGSSNGLENTRESESHAAVQNSQNSSSSSSSAAVVDPAKSGTGKTPEDQKDHLTATNEKGLDENAVNVSQQLADSSAENNVQQGEKKTPTNAEDNQQTSSQTPPTKVQIDAKHEESTQGNHRDAADATSPSTSNPNSTEGQMKEVPNNVNIMVMMAPDSSIITSYMVPLVLFVCAVGFVMVP